MTRPVIWPEPQARRKGAVLVEILAALMVSGVLAVLLISVAGLTGSEGHQPTAALKDSLALQEVMANITADYHRMLADEAALNRRAWEPGVAYAAGDEVTAANRPFGHVYRCISGGTSNPVEPAWPAAAGATVTETGGGPVWREIHSLLDELKIRLATLDGTGIQLMDGLLHQYEYGYYRLDFVDYIVFSADVEALSGPLEPDAILKVEIRSESGDRRTALFTAIY